MFPKQLLELEGQSSLLQQTFSRLSAFIQPKNILSVTNVKHSSDVKFQIGSISPDGIVLSEPFARNTAPAIACSLEFIKRNLDGDETVIIVPSDHLIKDDQSFAETVKQGDALARQGYIVTFGIKPTYPETGYGYILANKPLENGFKVERFVEKPDLSTAEKYVADGGYYWNGGIFMGKVSVLLDEFKRCAPDIFDNLKNLSLDDKNTIKYSVYEQMPSISIDYAVMEKSDKIALVPLKSDWNDLGSWQALYEVKPKDANGNVIIGNAAVDGVKNSFIYSTKNIVAAADVENVVLVNTDDAVMLCNRENSQDVKKLYNILEARGDLSTKLHKTIFRPWGYYTCLNSGDGYLTKIIVVSPHQKLSYQMHEHRSEHWVVLEGNGVVFLEGKKLDISAKSSLDIPVRAKHSLQNPYDAELKIIEVQQGDVISEDDIIRFDDIYGRA